MSTIKKLRTYIRRLQQRIQQERSFFRRLFFVACLFFGYVILAFAYSIVLIFYPPQKSFALFYEIQPKKGYTTSYQHHRILNRNIRLGTASTTLIIIIMSVLQGVLISPTPVHGTAYTVTCSGGQATPTAITESTYTINDTLIFVASGSGYCNFDEQFTVGTLTIQSGVKLIHTAGDTDGVTMTATNIDIQSGSTLLTNASSTTMGGCAGGTGGNNGQGPNTSTGVCAATTSGYGDGVSSGYGGGGAYGGAGGASSDGVTSTTYGSETAPTLLGSGGGAAGSGDGGGTGAGRVYLNVANSLTVSGTINANGGGGGTGASGAGGGGSGGSIYIITKTFAGSGTISADGGVGGNSLNNALDGAGGGGGRVAVYYDSSTFSGSITATKGTKGSGATAATDGSDGTTYTLQCTTPDTPSISSPVNAATGVSRNPAITASAYSANCAFRTQVNADWKVTTDSGGNTVVWSKDDDTSNLTSTTVNTTNGTFSGALSGATKLVGNVTYYIFVRYNNQIGDSSWSTVTSFTTANASPVFSGPISDQTTNEDTNVTAAFDLDSYFSDADSDALTYSVLDDLSASLGTMTVNGNGTVDFTLAANMNGSDTVQFRATDTVGATADSNTVTISVNAVNDAPSFTTGSNQTVNEDDGAQTVVSWATAMSVGSSDESGQTLTFNVSNTNNDLFSVQPAISSNGTLTYTPAADTNGSATVTIALVDSGGTANGGDDAADAQTFTITVIPINDAPVANGGSDQTVNEDDVDINLDGSSSTDVDGDILTYNWIELIDSADSCSISNETNVNSVITVQNKNSNYSCEFRLTVNDGELSSTDTVSVNVTADNDVPTFTGTIDDTEELSPGTVFANIFNLNTYFSDADVGDGCTYDLANALDPEIGSLVIHDDGAVDLYVNADASGTDTIQFVCTDTQSATIESNSIEIHIQSTEDSGDDDIPSDSDNNAPIFSESLPNISFIAGTTTASLFDLDDYFSDGDQDVLTYSVSGNDFITIDIDNNGIVIMTADIAFTGAEAVQFTATDPDGEYTDSNTVIVEVSESVTEESISHVEGAFSGSGVITIIGKNGGTLASWQAFSRGGVIPRIASVNNDVYVFAIKRLAGSNVHIYDADGNRLKSKRLSSKLHWRKFTTGSLDNQTKTIETVTATRRGSVIYFKIYSYDTEISTFILRKRTRYQRIQTHTYQTVIQDKSILLLNKQGKTIFRWRPY